MYKRFVRDHINKAVKSIAIKTASHYANVTCPVITYQPKISDAIKRLRNK